MVTEAHGSEKSEALNTCVQCKASCSLDLFTSNNHICYFISLLYFDCLGSKMKIVKPNKINAKGETDKFAMRHINILGITCPELKGVPEVKVENLGICGIARGPTKERDPWSPVRAPASADTLCFQMLPSTSAPLWCICILVSSPGRSRE